MLYAMDQDWWKQYLPHARMVFAGALVAPFSHLPGVTRTAAPRRANSGAGAIAFAAHAGARRIILLGYDGQHTGGRTHWHGDHPASLPNAGCAEKWPAQFRALLPELRGLEVLNCSRATALDAFPRLDLEDVLCSTPGCTDWATTSTSARSSAKCLESIT